MMPACTGPDRNLVQAFALGGEELVGLGLARGPCLAERMADIPEAEIEPGPRVGRADGVQAEQIADRAFEPDRRRMAARRRSGSCRPCRCS